MTTEERAMPEVIPLPEGYDPFEELIVCSNTMKHGVVPISVDGMPPFLVGKGPKPLLWINMQTSTGWQPLVRASRSLHEDVEIKTPQKGVWQTCVKGEVILEVHVKSEASAEIRKLNLLPVGFKIFGDEAGLRVGTYSLIGNTILGVHTMIAIEGSRESTSK